jgi:RND family efflux transporter MFP subunit
MNPPEADASVRPRPHLGWIFMGVAGLLVIAGLLLQWTAPDPEALPPAEAQAPVLHTYELRLESLQPRATLSGLLEPRRRVELFAEVEGRVLEVGAHELDRVETGALLVRMEPILAEVAISRAQAAIARAESEGQLARANLQRNQGLANLDATSRARLDEARNGARLARAAQLEAQAALVEAEDRLAKKTIRAPFTGVLRSFPVEEGEYLRPGEQIAELLDVERLRITIGLTDRQIVTMRPGTRVKLTLDALTGEPIEAEVVRVGGAIDLTTRKFPVHVEVDNAKGELLPGMVARVDLTLAQPRSVITLPLDAVVGEYGLNHVFVVEMADLDTFKVVKRRVEVHTIPFQPTKLELLAGLAEGERIAISSVRQLRDGMAVRPLPPGRNAALTSRVMGP